MPEQIGLQAVFQTTQFQSGLSQYMRGIDQAKGATNSAASSASSAGSIITSALGYALGNVLVQAAQAAVGALGNFIRSGIQTVATFQMLEISIESLTAKELLLSGGITDMATAMQMAVPITDVLMQRLQEIALLSPFSYEDVVSAYRLSISYGVTAEQALKLSEAILNMAVVSGQGQIAIERITRSLSQMQATGKITMIDVRELANSGVNLASILKNQLGMSIDEVNEKLADGSLTMQQVLDAIIQFTNLTIGDAAERMQQSFMGVTNALKELGSFVARDIFTPFVELLSKDLYSLYESAKQLYDSGVFAGIGQALANIYNAAKDIPSAIGKIITSLQNTFGSGIGKIVNDAFQWGVNIIAQLAKGIVQGAADFLVGAMRYISDLLEAWLAPGSPPRIAPDIDTWGMEAMNEYLNGFSDADFSALDSLQNALSSAFSALNIDDSSGTMAKLSEMYAEALSGGELDASFFDQLAQAAGPFGDEIAQLAAQNLQLADATEAVAAAEAAVTAASQKEQAARQKSVALTNEYNDLLKAGAPEDVLQAKLDEINAQENIVKEAANEKKAAETELAVQQARVDLLQQQISLQEQLIQQLTELYALENEEPETPGGGGEGGGGGAGGGGAGGAITPGNLISNLQGILDQARQLVSDGAGGMWDIIVSKLSTAFAPVLQAWQNDIQPKLLYLETAFWMFVDNLKQRWAEMVQKFRDDFRPLEDWWNKAWPTLQKVAEDAWNVIKSAVENAWAAMQGPFETIRQKLEELKLNFSGLETVVQVVAGVLLTVVVGAIIGVAAVVTILAGLITGLITAVSESMKAFDEWKASVVAAVDIVKLGFSDIVEGAKKIGEAMSGAVKDWNLFWEGLGQLASGMVEIIGGAVVTILEVVTGTVKLILASIKGFVEGVVEFFKGLYDDLVGHSIVIDLMDKLLEVIGDGFKDLLDKIEDFASLVSDGFETWVGDLVDIIQDGLQAAMDAISNQFTNLYNKGAEILSKIADGIKSKAAYLTQTIKDTLNSAITQALQGVSVDSSVVAELGRKIALAIGQGVTDNKAEISSAVTSAILFSLDYAWANASDAAADLGKNIDYAVEEGLVNNRQVIAAALLTAINRAMDYTWANASDAMYQLGYDLMARLEDGIAAYGDTEQIDRAMNRVAKQLLGEYSNPNLMLTPPVAMARQPILSGNTYKTLNMPTSITVNGGMDIAAAEALVRRVVRSEFGV